MAYNETPLEALAASLAKAMGIEAPNEAQGSSELLDEYIEKVFGTEKADRIFMYNPDAVAQWIYEKYLLLMFGVISHTDFKLPIKTVMPSVTPVCFGTMYTGASPEVHGIRKYEKPVIKIDTLFDALIRAGKRPVIVADSECSMGKIFLERDMDYFIFDTREEVNAKAAELIISDRYDFIAVYNGNYDSVMHKYGPESTEALAELHANSEVFAMFAELIKNNWCDHNTLMGFAMDHGAHEIDGGCGSHGLDMEEDLNIVHLYKALKRG